MSAAKSGTSAPKPGEEKVMKIIALLQKEISLDTRAISAFREKLQGAARGAKKQKQAVIELQLKNSKLSKQVQGVAHRLSGVAGHTSKSRKPQR